MLSSTPSLTLTIVKRELLTGLRSWKSFLLLLALLGLLYSTAFFAMDTAATSYIFMSRAMRSLFSMQVFAVGAIVFAVIPALAAVSINGERQDENYDMLLTTLITPRRIVLGKFAAVLIRALLVAVAVLPFTGLVYFYAGVDVESFFGALAVLVPAALCNAAIGLWCSNTMHRPARSVLLTFGIIGLLAGLFPVITLLNYYVTVQKRIGIFSQFFTLFANHTIEIYSLFQLLIGTFFLFASLFPLRDILNSTLFKLNRASLAAINSMSALTRISNAPPISIPDGANPLGYKDLCGSAFSKPSVALAAFIIVAGTYGLFFYWIVSTSTELILTIGILERITLLLVIPPMVAILMIKERQGTNFEMLRITLLLPADLVRGKGMVLLRMTWPVILAILVCKMISILVVLFCLELPEYSPPKYIYIIDWFLLLPHLAFVFAAAILGASSPTKFVTAIGGAYGTTLLATLLLLFMQFSILDGQIKSEFSLTTVFLVTHSFLLGGAFVASISISETILTAHWDSLSGESRLIQEITAQPHLQPPNLPK